MPFIHDSKDHEDSILEPIAIVGMACRLPGSIDTSQKLWQLVKEKGSVQTPKVPANRFNIDAHLHPNLERPGSFNVAGGYFLDGNLEDFDPTFFNMTPVEAMWLDPQQRKMLEVCYEAFESAGLSLEAVSGSNTAVFVGSFTADYQQMSTKEPDFRHNYAATGVDPGIISNRIGNAFNLNGPSFTINTACSSSIYAIHNACNALRVRDCEAAITGGVNLILTVDQHMNTAKLGILSPTSTCHTFDESADGYGRAEGAGALYLKRFSDAIRDGDPIRAVIRSSAVNTNGKVPGMGITHPSKLGQERVVRMAYQKASLNASRTAYLECHGTGTPVGDPIEAHAVANAMNDSRPLGQPLLIGSIKANIGHSEAASGIFAVMKAALMTEAGEIPGVCGLKTINPAIDETGWNIRVQRDTTPWPAGFAARRAGVSSFGYGGTNGHIIVEEVGALYPSYQIGRSKAQAVYGHVSSRPMLVTMSAHDKKTLERNIAAHAEVVNDFYLSDVAYTLNERRTKFSHRAFTVAHEATSQADFAVSAFKFGTISKHTPELAFLFTGQGAQWAGMAVAAMDVFPEFLNTLQALDIVLQKLEQPPKWKIVDVLHQPPETSPVDDAEIGQPVCTAIQIAIVDLFAKWDIRPTVAVGHSSGEISAAYAAGLISAPEAIITAFYRGFVVKSHAPIGGMLAVGLGVEEVQPYIQELRDQVVVACQNSPSSVTLSGSISAIAAIKGRFDAETIFARELRTGKAYHSPQMDAVGPLYEVLVARACQRLSSTDLDWRRPQAYMISSVTGEVIAGEITTKYWSENLRSKVRFDQAVEEMARLPELLNVRSAIEIGPHSVLSGPFKQICKAHGLDRFTYTASLIRKVNSARCLIAVAGEMFNQKYPVNLGHVNSVSDTVGLLSPGDVKERLRHKPLLLVDLPKYQWNYERRYWAEPRFSHEQRQLACPRHDLLGSRVVGLSNNCAMWKNVLRHKDVPWLFHHSLGNESVFPAAGHMSMVIEAFMQTLRIQDLSSVAMTLRDISIKKALVIPTSDEGIEVQTRLQVDADNKPQTGWHLFTVESISDGIWTTHCTGRIAAASKPADSTHPVKASVLTQSVNSKRWYDAFHRVGFQYTNTFQPLQRIMSNGKDPHAAADVPIATASEEMVDESRYLLHPATVDACLQLIIISVNKGKHKEMPWGVVPVQIEEVTLRHPSDEVKAIGNAVAWTDQAKGRHFNTNSKLFTPSGSLVLDVKNLTCVAYEAAVPQAATPASKQCPYSKAAWKPDIDSLFYSQSMRSVLSKGHVSKAIGFIVELLAHKTPLGTAAVFGELDEVFDECTRHAESAVRETSLPDSLETFAVLVDEQCDLLIAHLTTTDDTLVMSERLASISFAHSKLIIQIPSPLIDTVAFEALSDRIASPRTLINLADSSIVLFNFDSVKPKTIAAAPTVSVVKAKLQICDSKGLQAGLSVLNAHVTTSTLALCDEAASEVTVIDDLQGMLLLNIEELEYGTLRSLLLSGRPVIWVTQGINQGKHVAGGMSIGFLRALRSEQANARILLLDFNEGEPIQSMSEAIESKLSSIIEKDSGQDTEFWFHNGCFHISRIVANEVLNGYSDGDKNIVQERVLRSGARLEVVPSTSADELIFSHKSDFTRLGNNEVEVQIMATEFNIQEIKYMPSQPRIAFARVLATGVDVSDTYRDQTVITYMTGPQSTVFRTKAASCAKLIYHDPSAAVSTLSTLSKVVNALLSLAQVQEKEHVLFLDPPRAMEEAAFGLSRALGFHLTCTHGNEPLSGSTAQKASVIVAHSFSTRAQEVWRAIYPTARFVLCEEAPQTAPDPLPFARGATFTATSVSQLVNNDSTAAGRLLKKSAEIMVEHGLSLTDGLERIDIESSGDVVPQAAVLSFEYGHSKIKIHPKASGLRLNSEAAYLLVGCLGGLGRSLTTRMFELGARHFAFLSRSGTDKPEAAQVVRSLEAAGADVTIFRADATDQGDVDAAISKIRLVRPIKGVVHAAMVLADGMYSNMTHKRFFAAIQPKVQGAINLHHGLKNVTLDFFVMTSSISAVLGNPGQINYCAANSFLDSLAYYRQLQGLPASSIALPMVLDVGVVAESDDLETSLSRKGLYGIDEQEMLHAFEIAMSRPVSNVNQEAARGNAQVLLGLEAPALAAAAGSSDITSTFWYNDARLSHVRAGIEQFSSTARQSQGARAGSGFGEILQMVLVEAGIEGALLAIAKYVMQKCSTILMLPAESFELEGQSIAAYGLDSMIGAELRNWLFREFALDLPFQELLAPTLTFRALAAHIGDQVGVKGQGNSG